MIIFYVGPSQLKREPSEVDAILEKVGDVSFLTSYWNVVTPSGADPRFLMIVDSRREADVRRKSNPVRRREGEAVRDKEILGGSPGEEEENRFDEESSSE